MFKNLTRAALFAAAGFATAGLGFAVDPPVDDTNNGLSLTGGYTIVAGEHDGKPLPPDHFAGSIVRFTADEVIGVDKDKKHIFVAKYKLDTTKKPWVITMKTTAPHEHESTGLIEKTKDTVRIIYDLPGGKVPTSFKTGEKQNMFVLKNEHNGEKPPLQTPAEK